MKKTIVLLPVLLLSLQGAQVFAVDAETLIAPQHMTDRGAKTVARTAERNAELAAILGITPAELTAYFAQGKTFQDVITLKGVSMDAVLQKLKASRIAKTIARIDADVASGKITAAQATELKARIQNTPREAGLGMMGGTGGGKGMKGNGGMMHPEGSAQLAKILGITTDALAIEQKAGKTFEQIVIAHGLTVDAVKKQMDAARPVRTDDVTKTGAGGRGMRGGKGPLEPLAKILGITTEEMRAQMKAGKTVEELLTAKGLTKEQVRTQLEAERPRKNGADGKNGHGMRGTHNSQ